MTTALTERPTESTALPQNQIDLIRRTVASGATNDELALFLYDCQRRGVHPLDKLLHFTKRGGRYTPVTSIDFMRSQAAMSGEMAGSDDPVFTSGGDGAAPAAVASATVTVYRLTQGHRYAYAATARWDEYYPGDAGGTMWRKMPHTMLGKCAEALALRKAFPQQLAGLYSREEMDQADGPKAGYVVEAPRGKVVESGDTAPVVEGPVATRERGADHAGSSPALATTDLPDGAVYLERIDCTPTKNKNVTKYLVTTSTGETLSTIKEQLGKLCEQIAQERIPVTVEAKATKWGLDLVAVHRLHAPVTHDESHGEPVTLDEIPF